MSVVDDYLDACVRVGPCLDVSDLFLGLSSVEIVNGRYVLDYVSTIELLAILTSIANGDPGEIAGKVVPWKNPSRTIPVVTFAVLAHRIAENGPGERYQHHSGVIREITVMLAQLGDANA